MVCRFHSGLVTWLCFCGFLGPALTLTIQNQTAECRVEDVLITSALRDLQPEDNSTHCLNSCPRPHSSAYWQHHHRCRLFQGRCLPVVPAETVSRLYDGCLPRLLPRSASGHKCWHRSDRVVVDFECPKGEIRDPCDVIDTNVTTLTLRHDWTFASPSDVSPVSPLSASTQALQCRCIVTSPLGAQSFHLYGASVARGGKGAEVTVWDHDNNQLVDVDTALPRPQGHDLRGAQFLYVTFRTTNLTAARQSLTIAASRHEVRVECGGGGLPSSSSPPSSTLHTKHPASVKSDPSKQSLSTRGTAEAAADVVTADVIHSVTTSADVISDETTSAADSGLGDAFTFPLKAFFLGVLSAALFLLILTVVVITLRRRCRRREPVYARPTLRFTEIRASDPLAPSLYNTPHEPLGQGPEPGSPTHHYSTLPHNQKRPASPLSQSTGSRLHLLPRQRTMSLPASTARSLPPPHSPPPPPLPASLTAIMNHVARVERVTSSGPGMTVTRPPGSGHVMDDISEQRPQRGREDNAERSELFSCDSSNGCEQNADVNYEQV